MTSDTPHHTMACDIVQRHTTLLITDKHGIYIPQLFIESYGDHGELVGLRGEDTQVLLAGPDHEWYWEAWETVLNTAKLCGRSLHQNGALYWVDYDGIDTEWSAYASKHDDAPDNLFNLVEF